MVTLTPTSAGVGDRITARLTDPDGNVRNIWWQWASSVDGRSGWTDIGGANSATFAPVAADLNRFLRATASYDDRDGTDKSAEGVTSVAVGVDDDGVVTLSSSSPTVGERSRLR